jgi:hypothetical protein
MTLAAAKGLAAVSAPRAPLSRCRRQPAQGEQRRSSYFNIRRRNPEGV